MITVAVLVCLLAIGDLIAMTRVKEQRATGFKAKLEAEDKALRAQGLSEDYIQEHRGILETQARKKAKRTVPQALAFFAVVTAFFFPLGGLFLGVVWLIALIEWHREGKKINAKTDADLALAQAVTKFPEK